MKFPLRRLESLNKKYRESATCINKEIDKMLSKKLSNGTIMEAGDLSSESIKMSNQKTKKILSLSSLDSSSGESVSVSNSSSEMVLPPVRKKIALKIDKIKENKQEENKKPKEEVKVQVVDNSFTDDFLLEFCNQVEKSQRKSLAKAEEDHNETTIPAQPLDIPCIKIEVKKSLPKSPPKSTRRFTEFQNFLEKHKKNNPSSSHKPKKKKIRILKKKKVDAKHEKQVKEIRRQKLNKLLELDKYIVEMKANEEHRLETRVQKIIDKVKSIKRETVIVDHFKQTKTRSKIIITSPSSSSHWKLSKSPVHHSRNFSILPSLPKSMHRPSLSSNFHPSPIHTSISAKDSNLNSASIYQTLDKIRSKSRSRLMLNSLNPDPTCTLLSKRPCSKSIGASALICSLKSKSRLKIKPKNKLILKPIKTPEF